MGTDDFSSRSDTTLSNHKQNDLNGKQVLSQGKLEDEPTDTSDATEFDDKPVNLVQAKLWERVLVVIFASMIAFGSHFGGISFGSLKDTFVSSNGPFNYSNKQAASLQAANDVLGIFLPLFGFLLDRYASGWGSLVISALVCVGSSGVALGMTFRSYVVILLGRVLYGAGAGAINVVQQMAVAHWFTGKSLGFAMGTVLMVNKLGAALGSYVVKKESDGTGNEAVGSYYTACFSILSLLFNISYVLMVKRAAKSQKHRPKKITAKKPVSLKSIFYFPGSFWLIMIAHGCSAGVMNSYYGVSTHYLKHRDNTKSLNSNALTTMSLVINAVVYFLMGPIVDHFGQRIMFSTFAAVTLVFFFVTLEWTRISSSFLMAVFGITIPLKALASLVAVPIMVSYGHLGTAFAVYKAVNAIGSTVSDLLVGYLQGSDKTHYTSVIIYYVALSVIAVLVNLYWWYLDRTKYDNLFQKNNKERKMYMDEKRRKELEAEAENVDIVTKERFQLQRAINAGLFIIIFNATWLFFFITAFRKNEAKAEGFRHPKTP